MTESLTVTLTVFGDLAKKIAKHLDLVMSGDTTDVNTKVYFTYKSIEGHPKIIVTFDL